MKYLIGTCNVALITLTLCAGSSILNPSGADAATRVAATERDSTKAKKVKKSERKAQHKKKAGQPSGKRINKQTSKNSTTRSSNRGAL